MDRSGCAVVIAVVMAVVFAGGLAVYWFTGQNQDSQKPVSAALTIAVLGASPVTADAVDKAYQASQQQFTQMFGATGGFEGLTPDQEARMLAQALDQSMDAAIVAELAKQNGVTLTDEQAKTMAAAEIEKQVQSLRVQLIATGKLKPDATEADLAAAFKKESGQDLATVRSQQITKINETLANPNEREALISSLVQMALVSRYEAMTKVTDDDLKRSTQVYTVQRIFVPSGGADAEATIAKAEAAVKTGQPFGDVVAEFSKDLPEPGKKLRDSRQSVPFTVIVTDPALASLRDLKAGQTSGVLELSNGFAIYKVEAIKGNAPKDLDQNRDTYQKPLVQGMAIARLTRERDALRKGKVEWKSVGYEALYEVGRLLRDAGPAPSKAQRPAFEAVMAKAQSASSSNDIGDRAAAYAALLASNAVWQSMTPEERKESAEGRVEILRNVLQSTESPSLRLEIAEILLTVKSADAVGEVLQAATNNSSYGPQGQAVNSQISSVLRKLEVANVVKPDESKAIEAQQQRWIGEKREDDKMKAEAKAQEAATQAEAAAAAKAEEAAAKQEAAKAKPQARDEAKPKAPAGR